MGLRGGVVIKHLPAQWFEEPREAVEKKFTELEQEKQQQEEERQQQGVAPAIAVRRCRR